MAPIRHWSFGWPRHWCRASPCSRWRARLGVIAGQVIEPLVEAIPFGGGLGWNVPPEPMTNDQ